MSGATFPKSIRNPKLRSSAETYRHEHSRAANTRPNEANSSYTDQSTASYSAHSACTAVRRAADPNHRLRLEAFVRTAHDFNVTSRTSKEFSVKDVDLTINCGGMINGEVVTAKGSGRGSVEQGTLGINLEFSHIPAGFSIYCASQWTACCSTPTFAIERDGGVNMLTLSKGRYRCNRTFDFGKYGSY